ncbi:hypothetical protein R6Z07F_006789 [Ovis aries]|uniref:Uncharacterized protein n=3 Tax=Ovis TaxID=9935 RepID=A0A836AF51_SHEEP|nr:hypothetical protein JEQ12_016515 [Ovis aries]KAI4541470.1 hypothetical protein MG293_008612 [Ovis ammon polii]KAI4569590.1 hypothetical protein MJT46_006884 [Ovis ammon polii x Ovis aries]KAI4584060.1 hypothetical protein MJG53_007339 [Ovis ammon polii x Ovis aries]
MCGSVPHGVTPLTLRGLGECWAYSRGRQSELRFHLRRLENRDGRGLDELTWGLLTVLCAQVSCPDGLQCDGRQEEQLCIHPPQAFRAFKLSPSEMVLLLFWGVDGSKAKSVIPSLLVQLPCLPCYFLLLFLRLLIASVVSDRCLHWL